MTSSVNLRALGLMTQPNSLQLPDGALTTASNIHIRRDNVIEPRRGFRLYGDTLGTSTDRAKQIFEYKSRILRHFQSSLEFDSDGAGTFLSFAESITEPETGRRIRKIQSNGNLYFTSNEGIKKISAASATDLTSDTGVITQAGGVKAVDLNGRIISKFQSASGFLGADAAVAYRVVWGITDNNNNLVLGTPSQRIELYNTLLEININDFQSILFNLDNIAQTGSLVDDGDYMDTLGVTSSTSATALRDNMVALATKIDNDIEYADEVAVAPLTIASAAIVSGVCTVTFSAGDPSTFFASGANIYLDGFIPTTGTLDGAQVVSSTTATTLSFNTAATGPVGLSGTATIVSNEYRSITEPSVPGATVTHDDLQEQQDYLENIIDQLQSEPSTVISTALLNEFIDPLDITTSSAVELTVTVPEDITTDHFYQVYRSAQVQATGVISLADLTPSDELQLVIEGFPTTVELAAGEVILEDITPDEFRGANLYTNASSGEGILQSNDVPPFALDVNQFKGYTFYANTKTRHRKSLSLLGVSNMITDYNAGTTPTLIIANSTDDNIYEFIIGDEQVTSVTCTSAAGLASAGTADYFNINAANNQEKYYVWYQVGTSTDPAVSGRTGIKVTVDPADSATVVGERTRDALKQLSEFFTVSAAAGVVTVTNIQAGYTDDATAETSGFTVATTTPGTGEKVSQQDDDITTVADVAGSLAGTYFTLNTTFDKEQYYVWYRVSGAGVDPALTAATGIVVDIATNDTAPTVASATQAILDATFSDIWDVSVATSTLTVKNVRYGKVTAPTAGTSGFTISNNETGQLQVLLSDDISPAQAVDETSRSLVKIVNKNPTEEVYLYYISGTRDVPGQMLVEARGLADEEFYLMANNSNTGLSFNPDLSPSFTITSIGTGDPTTMLVTTSAPHGLINQQQVLISNSDSTPTIDGIFSITYVSTTTFRVNKTVGVAGTEGVMSPLTDVNISENEEKSSRIYYSKFQQPEAVPITNYIDVGASDKAILRIFPLRDSLFVFKEDGLHRISGELAPFSQGLFDSSCIVNAPDSVDVSNNRVYCWTTQGISTVSESGVTVISRPIDDQLLKLNSDTFINFSTATFGVGYESEQAYVAWTVVEKDDTVATIAYRYSALTDTWTTYDKTDTCGMINPVDDKMYLGAGDANYLEQERKDFERTDFADREYDLTIDTDSFFGDEVIFSDVTELAKGDVMVQTQNLTIYEYNNLLNTLDTDPGVTDTDYFSTLEAVAGDQLRTKLTDLATKLDADAGVTDTDYSSTIAAKTGPITAISIDNPAQITATSHGLVDGRRVTISGSDSTPSIDGEYTITLVDGDNFTIPTVVISPGTTGTFTSDNTDFLDIKANYNAIINKLNLDTGVVFKNYRLIDTESDFEVEITAVDQKTKRVSLGQELELVLGPVTVYKAISSQFVYAPATFNDPVNWKHLRETTLMFESMAFTSAIMSTATDVLPEFIENEFNGDGKGIFGHENGFGAGFFGGASSQRPLRTYIPRDSQRCRYIVAKLEHKVARESYALFGITISGEMIQSTRAYR